MRALAKELGVVLPVSFFERANQAVFNSIAIVDADGSVVGVYRKSHIPDGPGYQEKFYFSPGDTGFRVFETRYAKIGIGICWDQWFPETARCLALQVRNIDCFGWCDILFARGLRRNDANSPRPGRRFTPSSRKKKKKKKNTRAPRSSSTRRPSAPSRTTRA
jgi:hypothetical protein